MFNPACCIIGIQYELEYFICTTPIFVFLLTVAAVASFCIQLMM